MYTNGLTDRFGSPLISKRDLFKSFKFLDSTYAKNATLFGGEHRTATGNDNTQSWSAVRIPSDYVPHLQPINEIKLTTLNTNETTPMYLGAVAISDNEQQSQLLKLSTNAVTWTVNSEVKWEFGNDGFIIPIGYQLELYLVANESDFVLPIPATDVLLQCSMDDSIGVGEYRPVGDGWGGPRLLDCVLVTNAHIKDETHLTELQKEELNNFIENKDKYFTFDNYGIDYVVDTGVTDNNWYRIYKSGWVEQGGITSAGSSGTTERTVTLPVELKTPNYFVQLTQTGYYNSTYAYQVKDLTVTNFKIYTHTGAVQNTAAMWEAKGLRTITNDIIRANGYIPNASSWNSSVFVSNNLTITKVEDEFGYNGDNKTIIMQTSLIENGSNLMKGNTNLTSWNSNLSNLTNGSSMFKNCTNLTTVSFGEDGLDQLNEATDMFYGCSLNYQSLNNILNALPSRSGTIYITVADSVKSDLENDENFEDVEIPAYNSGNYYELTHSSGWKVRLTSQSGFNTTSYDVSEANGYIPDASKWNEEVYLPYNPTIVSVVDGVAYDGLV